MRRINRHHEGSQHRKTGHSAPSVFTSRSNANGNESGDRDGSATSSPARKTKKLKNHAQLSSDDDFYASQSASEQSGDRRRTLRRASGNNAVSSSNSRSFNKSTSGLELNDLPAASPSLSERSASEETRRLPKRRMPSRRANSKPKSLRESDTGKKGRTRDKIKGEISDSDSDDGIVSDSSPSPVDKGKPSIRFAKTKEPLVGSKHTGRAGEKPVHSALQPESTASPVGAKLKSWIQNILSQPLTMGIVFALAVGCVLSFGAGGSGGSDLTSLAGGGMLLIVIVALGLWAWYGHARPLSGEEHDVTATKDKDASKGHSDPAGSNKKDTVGDADDDPSSSEDDDKEGKGYRKGKSRGNPGDNKSEGLARDHARSRDMSERFNRLWKNAEDHAYEFFPDINHHLVRKVLNDYTQAPWTEPTDSIKELERADIEVWKTEEKRPGGDDFSKRFDSRLVKLRKEARKLFAGLMSCSGAYLSGDQMRVELMSNASKVAIRLTAFPGERLSARPGTNDRDAITHAFDREKLNFHKGLNTLSLMKEGWSDLPIPHLSEMPPIEIVCIRPPADFTPNEFDEISGLKIGTVPYNKKRRRFGRTCSAERTIGEYAQGYRQNWIVLLLKETQPERISIDFLPHRRFQAEQLDWNDLSSTSTRRHIHRFDDVIDAVEHYTKTHELRVLDIGPCIPLDKNGIRTQESVLEKFAGKFSFRRVKDVEILRIGLDDPSIWRDGFFNEAAEVAKTLCTPGVGVLDLFQPRPEGQASKFLLEAVNNAQVESFKKCIDFHFSHRLDQKLDMAGKLVNFCWRADYLLPDQHFPENMWADAECRRLEGQLTAHRKKAATK